MDIGTLWTKIILVSETSAEEIVPSALKQAEFDYQNESYHNLGFEHFGPSGFRCKKPSALLNHQVNFTRREMWIDSPDGWNAASSFGEQKLLFWEKIKTFRTFGVFG